MGNARLEMMLEERWTVDLQILVGGLVAIFYFPRNIGLLIIPIDFHIFQRGSNHQPELIEMDDILDVIFDFECFECFESDGGTVHAFEWKLLPFN